MATGWLIFVEKRHRLQVLRMLIMRRGLYTGEILRKLLGKNRRKIGELIYDNDLTNERFGASFFFIKIYYATISCMRYIFTFGKC